MIKLSLLLAVILCGVSGCGTTVRDTLPETATLTVYVTHIENDTPIQGAPIIIRRFFDSGSFSMGSYVLIAKGLTDHRGVFTYSTNLSGSYQVEAFDLVKGPYYGGFKSIPDMREDKTIHLRLRNR